MGRSRYRFGAKDAPHFLTNSIVSWLPLFSAPPIAQIILNSWHHLQQNDGLKLHGYVIMEDHIHWMASHDDLPRIATRFKSFTARQIIDHLKQNGPSRYLSELAFNRKKHKNESQYQLWQEGSHPQEINGGEMANQKLEYMHYNPIRRGYVDEAEHWRYSSARNYQDTPGLLEIDRLS